MLKEEALEYHSRSRPGKIEVQPTKPTNTQQDLTLAYSPGVAIPCLEIAKERELAYRYTAKSNLVAVVTNGSAVLGLGNIGPEAAKPVMEGKGVLFKKFADIDVFDLELDAQDPDALIQIVKSLGPTFGGINLEDIKAPECFYIERELQKRMDIPVFHDDQHGTAIITGAALLNALELVNKDIRTVKVVFSGAGAAAIGCANLYTTLGMQKANITMVDLHGVVYRGREAEMEPHLAAFAQDTPQRSLAEAIRDADVFVGLSAPNVLSVPMLESMASDPIIFALANPDPEIPYEVARQARPDAILATGRSDYPNQVNNVLCFPHIFRGALDVQAREINQAMKLAAVQAFAALAKDNTPDAVLRAYWLRSLHYVRNYLSPTPFDPRVLLRVAPAVAQAAIQSGVARGEMLDLEAYHDRLASSQGIIQHTARRIIRRARHASPMRRVVFPEATHTTILRACHEIVQEKIAIPVLLGDEQHIVRVAKECQVSLKGVEVLDHRRSPLRHEFAEVLFKERQRKGMEQHVAALIMERMVEFGLMMVKTGHADCFVGGITRNYPRIIRPALQIVGIREGIRTVSGFYLLLYRDRTLLLADTTVNLHLSAETLAEITLNACEAARFFGLNPKAALLSYSNFGSVPGDDLDKITATLDIVRKRDAGLMIDGEMQAHLALNASLRQRDYPFCTLEGEANVLIFPNLEASNTAYRLLSELSDCEILGPVLMGMSKPVNVISQEAQVRDVVNMAAISVVESQEGVV